MEHNSTFQNGMNADTAKIYQPQNTYLKALDYRPISDTGSSVGSLVNIRGNECAVTFPELKGVFNYKPKEYRRSIKCIHCGADTKNKKYCSPKCFAENKILTKPTKEDLQKLLNEYTYSEIAEKLEVARTTIFKWTSEYGLTNNSGQGRIQA